MCHHCRRSSLCGRSESACAHHEPIATDADRRTHLPPPTLGGGVDGASAELFERRAGHPAGRNASARWAVAELCEQLDGLPLAIELAAARIRTMSVAEITARLEERFALLRGTDRSAPDRHRTLYAVIEWSWGSARRRRARRAFLCAIAGSCRLPRMPRR